MNNTTIHWKPVQSSNIKAIAYDKSHKTLYIKFNWKDAMYQYSNVSLDTYAKLRQAESLGKAFNTLIKPHKEATKL